MPDVKFQSDSAGSVRVPWHQPAPVATGSGNGCFAQLVAGPQAGQGVQAAPAQVLFFVRKPGEPGRPDRSDGRFWSTGLVGALHGFDGAPWARRAGGYTICSDAG